MAESGLSKKSLRAGLCFKRPTITSIRQWKRSMFGVGIRSFWSWRDFQKFPPKASASATVTGTASSVGLVFARPKGQARKKTRKMPQFHPTIHLIHWYGARWMLTPPLAIPQQYIPWPGQILMLPLAKFALWHLRRSMFTSNYSTYHEPAEPENHCLDGENSVNPNLNESTCEESLQASGLFFEYRISTKRTLDDGLVLGTVRISKAWTNGQTDERTNERTNEWMKKRKNDELIMNESPTIGKCGPLLKPGLIS